jgi:hypothetical protein
MGPESRTDDPTRTSADADALQEGLRFTEEFHMQRSPVHKALARLVRRLDDAAIPYAVIGAMALNGHGYVRATVDIDVLVTRDGLERFRTACLGRGYVERFDGSRGVRDTEADVPIDFVVAGEYPGDGQPKTVVFPDPADAQEIVGDVALARLDVLVELKLASGISAPHRLRDLADVLELIRARDLPEDFADQLDASVREKYRELWTAAQSATG